MENTFKLLNSINVNSFTEKKNNLTYLSWAHAWSEVKKSCSNATYKVIEDPLTHKPYFYDEHLGYMVMTEVTIEAETLTMWLPVMDGANKAMMTTPYTYKTKYGDKTVEAATMFDINKTLMRCLVKNLAMFGLGLYIYAGEDLPTEIEHGNEPKTQPIDGGSSINSFSVKEQIKPSLNIGTTEFGKAKKYIIEGGDIEIVKTKYNLTADVEAALINNK